MPSLGGAVVEASGVGFGGDFFRGPFEFTDFIIFFQKFTGSFFSF